MTSDIELLDEILRLKNQIVKMEMHEKETKAKINELVKHLGKNKEKAAPIWDGLKKWASKNN